MSGHDNFTWWVNSEAKTVIHKGVEKEIESTFFTPTPAGYPESYLLQNPDEFNISFKDDTVSNSYEGIDRDELSKRYKEWEKSKKFEENLDKINPRDFTDIVKSRIKGEMIRIDWEKIKEDFPNTYHKLIMWYDKWKRDNTMSGRLEGKNEPHMESIELNFRWFDLYTPQEQAAILFEFFDYYLVRILPGFHGHKQAFFYQLYVGGHPVDKVSMFFESYPTRNEAVCMGILGAFKLVENPTKKLKKDLEAIKYEVHEEGGK